MTISERLMNVQQALKAPKNQENKFGGYRYRSCEDILEAVKPLLKENGLCLTISDDIQTVGGRIYVKATATVFASDGTYFTVSAFAREEETKKGMDSSQITGAASSYARKYALNGLFCIDDTRDSDATNDGSSQPKPQPKATPVSAGDTYTPTCRDCRKAISDAEHDWSVRVYGMPLCREHQKNHERIKK